MGNGPSSSRFRTMLPCSDAGREGPSSSSDVSLESDSSSSSDSESSSDERMTPDQFQIIQLIGKGSFSLVYAVEKRSSKELYAMKVVGKDSGEDSLAAVRNEINILSTMNHSFVVTLWFAFEDEDTVYQVFELLPGGDLRRSLVDQGHLPEAQVLAHVCELALALDYLRTKRIVHRDVKPENILLDCDGHVRLTDFNVAIELKDGDKATALCGTMPYIAPEVFKSILNMEPGYSYPADWWSLGICTYELICGERPYDIHFRNSYEEILGTVLLQKLKFPRRMRNGVDDLIQQILTVDTEQRLCSADQMRQHPYLQHIDFDRLHIEKRCESIEPLSENETAA